ncbi:hypothetical protein CAE01nite_03180 [Cellulomonas aerilata]|uniref:Uncharacterized protein n=1 Tax=Cellulomonas aerilata TaxID=515326 RepID=A0A512D806_9CELL|nr:hypothetical protein CAE01nite_03180 [Cellulomonas aerilata]
MKQLPAGRLSSALARYRLVSRRVPYLTTDRSHPLALTDARGGARVAVITEPGGQASEPCSTPSPPPETAVIAHHVLRASLHVCTPRRLCDRLSTDDGGLIPAEVLFAPDQPRDRRGPTPGICPPRNASTNSA